MSFKKCIIPAFLINLLFINLVSSLNVTNSSVNGTEDIVTLNMLFAYIMSIGGKVWPSYPQGGLFVLLCLIVVVILLAIRFLKKRNI